MLVAHIVFALLSAVLGLIQLIQSKGTTSHKFVGRAWVVSMAWVSVSSFWLTGFAQGHRFSWLHGLSLWTLVCLVALVYCARVKNVRGHKRFALGAYIGLLSAGAAAVFMPNRLLYQWLWG